MSISTIIAIIVGILLARVIFLSIADLIITFYDNATNMAVKEIMKNPARYVRYKHFTNFMYNMFWIVIFTKIFIAALTGNINITFNQ